jgi:hypothetical protein
MAKLNLALAGADRAAVIERLKTRTAVRELAAVMRRLAPALVEARPSETDAELAQELGQLQPFLAVSPQECVGQLASFGPA